MTGTRPPSVATHLEQFVRRIILDALLDGDARYWQRRADELQAARWRPSDFTGHAAPERLAARDERLREAVLACQNRALLTRLEKDQ